MWNLLISPIANLAGTWLQGKVDEKKADNEVKVAKAVAKARVYEKEATTQMLMEESLTSQMAGSWKDEFWTIIFGLIKKNDTNKPPYNAMKLCTGDVEDAINIDRSVVIKK